MEHWYSYVVHAPTLDRTWSDQNEFGIHYQQKCAGQQYYRIALYLCYDPEDARTWKSVCVKCYSAQNLLTILLVVFDVFANSGGSSVSQNKLPQLIYILKYLQSNFIGRILFF